MKDSQNHLTLSDRITVEELLNEGQSFTLIASAVHKDPSTISKEVRKHRTIKQHKTPHKPPKCVYYKTCTKFHACGSGACYHPCNTCNKCYSSCSDYEAKTCGRLKKAPYVCNACSSIVSCQYYRFIYVAKYADDSYHELLSSSREGIDQNPEAMQKLDQLVSPLLLKGQSLAHIYANHRDEIGCSRRTLYKYIDKNVFSARNIDLPRKVKYKSRRKSRKKINNKEYCKGRTYEDFTKYLQANPTSSVVEMDTVEGQKGGKVLLTLFFRSTSLMLIYLLDSKCSDCVKEVLDSITSRLGLRNFRTLFPVILTDRGCEFQTPKELENNSAGKKRTSIYYCNPQCSWQKGMIEKNHEFIRYVIPKGTTMDCYSQKQITLLMNHINSTARDNLNGHTPYQLSQILLNPLLLHQLSVRRINHDEVILKPALLK